MSTEKTEATHTYGFCAACASEEVTQQDDREMKAFVAGWFAHARQRDQMLVEDAWHVYRIGDICPGCLKKPCGCPVDDSAARAIFEQMSTPPGGAS